MSLGSGAPAAAAAPAASGGAPAAAAAGGTPPPAAANPPGIGQAAPVAAPRADGSQPTWRDTLPDDLKADPTLNKYSDVQNLAKAHIELQKKFGEKGIFKPGKDASPEQIKAFREELGIPTDVAKYDMGQFEGVEVDPAIVDWAKKVGVEQGIEPAAMKQMMTSYMQIEAQNEQTMDVMLKEDIKAGYEGLRKDWGDAFDRNIQRADFAARVVEEKSGAKGLIERLKDYGADNDPLILKAFNHVASLLGEDKLREGGAGDGRQTPAELDAEFQSVQSQLLQLSKGDGRRPALLQKFESLSRQKTGGR